MSLGNPVLNSKQYKFLCLIKTDDLKFKIFFKAPLLTQKNPRQFQKENTSKVIVMILNKSLTFTFIRWILKYFHFVNYISSFF